MSTITAPRHDRGQPCSPAVTGHPSVTVVVLSYNNTALTLACLDSLLADFDGGFELLVVDNASTDGAPAAIKARHPNLAMLELPQNRGWAGGNNAGVEHALRHGARLVCLLNNDTIVPVGTIAALAETAERFAASLVHPAIDYADAAEGKQLDPSVGVHIEPSSVTEPLPGAPGIFALNYAYGACLMVPAAVWQDVGGLDERFFLQMEETDFWLRAKRLGVRSLCDTRVCIQHAESKSFGGRMTPTKSYYIVRNTLLLAEKHAAGVTGWLRACRKVYWFSAKRAAAAGASGSTAAVLRWSLSADPHGRAVRAGLRDYARRRFGRISNASLRAVEHDAGREGCLPIPPWSAGDTADHPQAPLHPASPQASVSLRVEPPVLAHRVPQR